jgi:hypothetical protein
MTIKAVTDGILNLPVVFQISSLIGRINNVVRKNQDAADEAQTVAMLATAGTAFGLLTKSVLMLNSSSFSGRGLFLFGLLGCAAGTVAASSVIYSFFSKMKNREKI